MKRMYGKFKKAMGASSSSSSYQSSSTHYTHESMEEDGANPAPMPALEDDSDLDIQGREERKLYDSLKNRLFAHTKAYDPELLHKIGMESEFTLIWQAVGWSGVANVFEKGSRLLTIQFLCTLKRNFEGITFRIFREEYSLLWKDLATILGFNDRCRTEIEINTPQYDKASFWFSITGKSYERKPKNNDIHNPTLRLMHKWIAMTLFPRPDFRIVREDEMRILYAIVHKIKIAPVKCMIKQWLENLRMNGVIECTSLITRILHGMGILKDKNISYIPHDRVYVDEEYLIQGHTLKHGLDGSSLLFFSPGHTYEIPLPNPGYRLYECPVLTIPLEHTESARRSNVNRRFTRSQTTRERGGPSRRAPPSPPDSPMQDYTARADPAGHTSAWDLPPQPQDAGTPTWGSASTGQWVHDPAQYNTQHYAESSGGPYGFTSPYGDDHHQEGMSHLQSELGELRVEQKEIRQELRDFRDYATVRFDHLDRTCETINDNLNRVFARQGFPPEQ
jgi:hypothetical protein